MSNSSSQHKPLGNHQRTWIWGRHLVLETLQAGRWPILELLLANDLKPSEVLPAIQCAEERRIPYQQLERNALTKRCREDEHQGYAARMAEYPYAPFEELFRGTTPTADQPPLWVMLDGIQDPFNCGTMLRSAEVFAATGIILGMHNQVGVTSHVARSSVGAVNRLVIHRSENLAETCRQFRERGIAVVGASEQASLPAHNWNFRQPTLLILGNEGHGLSPEVKAACITLVKIPQLGTLNSLNAAAAMAILCYEVRRQQAGF